jgi:hypothetical protein
MKHKLGQHHQISGKGLVILRVISIPHPRNAWGKLLLKPKIDQVHMKKKVA